MPKKPHTLTNQIRAAVDRSGLGRNEVARRAGLDKGALSGFMAEKRGMGLRSLDKLAEALGLRIVMDGPAKAAEKRSETGRKRTKR